MVNRCILSAISHPPILPIQTPILYRLRQMPDFDMFRIIQVGYRAGDFQDTVIGTGGEAETLHGRKRRERRTDGVAWSSSGHYNKYPHKRQNAFPGSHGLL